MKKNNDSFDSGELKSHEFVTIQDHIADRSEEESLTKKEISNIEDAIHLYCQYLKDNGHEIVFQLIHRD